MITATQEKVIPAPGRHGMVYVDTVHRRALERGRVAEVQGRPHQRGDPRPHRGREGAVQPAAVRGGEDLPEDHPPLGLPRPRRAAHARGRLDVRDPVAPRADRQVRPDDQAQALQRRGGRREGQDQEDRRAGAARRHQARGHERHLDALHHEGARQRALRQRRGQLHQPDQRPRGADQHGQGSRPARRHPQAVPRVPAGRAAQGVSRDPREGDHQGVRLLLPGAGRVAVPELPRPRRGLRQQDARSRTATPRRSCSPTRASSSRSRSRSPSSARPPRASARRSSPTCGRRAGAARRSPTAATSRSRRRSRRS